MTTREENHALALSIIEGKNAVIRDLHAAIHKLTSALIEAGVERSTLRAERDALRKDAARLDWLADSQEIEGFANDSKDLYEYAAIVADERGHDDDPTVSDQREGFRRMIDAAMAVQP